MSAAPQQSTAALSFGLTDKDLALTPMCNVCGWRKGGQDSWNGSACKCGHTSLTFGTLLAAARSVA